MDIRYEQLNDFHIDTLRNSYAYDMPFFHYHSCYEIFILTHNDRKIVINDKIIDLAEGDIVLIPPMVFHRTLGSRCSRIVINFTDDYLKRFFSNFAIQKLTKCFAVPKITLNDNDFQELQNLCKTMLNSKSETSDETFFALTSLLLLLYKNANFDAKEEDDSILSLKIMSYIKDNFRQISSLGEISDKFFISKEHLCRIFKKTYDMTVITYINILKLNYSCTLLTGTQNSVQKIAEECGFSSLSYFCRLFKKQYSMSPIDYRSKHREVDGQ